MNRTPQDHIKPVTKSEFPAFSAWERRKLAGIYARIKYLRDKNASNEAKNHFQLREMEDLEWAVKMLKQCHDDHIYAERCSALVQTKEEVARTGMEEDYYRSKRGLDGFDAGFKYLQENDTDPAKGRDV